MVKKIVGIGLIVAIAGGVPSAYGMNWRSATVLAATGLTASLVIYQRLHAHQPVLAPAGRRAQQNVRQLAVAYPRSIPSAEAIAEAIAYQSASPLVKMPREVLWHIASFLGADPEQEEQKGETDLRSVNRLFTCCKALNWKPFYRVQSDRNQNIVIPFSCERRAGEHEDAFYQRFLGRLRHIITRFQGLPNLELHLDLSHRLLSGTDLVSHFIEHVSRLPVADCITQINLSDNAIGSTNDSWRVPFCPAIGSFKNLKVLNVGSTLIRLLPDTIGNLVALEELDASFTNLNRLPIEIGQCQRLRKLQLQQTSCDQIPDTIRNLIALEICNIAHSNVRGLPASMNQLAHLGRLRRLNLSGLEIPAEQIDSLRREGLTILQ